MKTDTNTRSPETTTPLPRHGADSETYNRGRAEGRADVITALRAMQGPLMEKADADAVLRCVAIAFRRKEAPTMPPIGIPAASE